MKELVCPVCKTEFENNVIICSNCGFPFDGTEKEKAVFIGQQVLKKDYLSETKNKIKRARIILWIMGAINIIFSFLIRVNDPFAQKIQIIIGIIIGLIFIGYGFLSYKKPVISILIPLLIIVALYIISAILNPATIFQGILWKIIILFGLIYGLIAAIKAEKLRKESNFLNKHKK